jgi:hypothetical protein
MAKKTKETILTPAQIISQQKKARQDAFLAAFAKCGVIGLACKNAGIARRTVYTWIDEELEFTDLWESLKEDYVEKLEQEADRRAIEGVDHPVTYEGEITATYKDYSDTLLIFRLKSLKPEKYRDNFHVTGKVEQAFDRETLDAIMKSPKARELARSMAAEIVAHQKPDGSSPVIH